MLHPTVCERMGEEEHQEHAPCCSSMRAIAANDVDMVDPIPSLGVTLPQASTLGVFQRTPDPNTSAKVSRYKWEPYRDTNWWCIYYFLGRAYFAKISR